MAGRLSSGGRYYGDNGQTRKPGAALKTKQPQEAAESTCRRLPPIDRDEASKSAGREEGRRQEEASWEPKHTKSAIGDRERSWPNYGFYERCVGVGVELADWRCNPARGGRFEV
ncbi:hypothetical protein MKX08_010664 [Trichoderma sp. CBMAI-0020]|nr:hypothetical protein MKX08_010664 [Trichoderma sp. CBMAI-0020]